MDAVITLQAAKPRLSVSCPLGAESPTQTGGYGSWSETARPKRASLTDYVGRSPFRQSVPILLDGFATDTSVEPTVGLLERLASPDDKRRPPPVLTLAGPLPRVAGNWVLESIDWGAALRNTAGERVRQEATLTLLELVADKRLRQLPPGRPRFYTTHRGDTLRSIAARQLGDARHWHDIFRLNQKRLRGFGRSPNRALPVGKRLRMP